MSFFDEKTFNPTVFGTYVNRVPKTKKNELIKSGVLRSRADLKSRFDEQTGGNYVEVPLKGILKGTPVKYDGQTNITAETQETFMQGMVVTGHAAGFVEKDFSTEMTGVDFEKDIASQIADFWEDYDQDTILAILKGIFSMSAPADLPFVNLHTTDISGLVGASEVGLTTLNTAAQKACGDNKNIFNFCIMHSAVSTQLENLNLVTNLKYTDANGIQRDLGLATWNGKLVLIDDSMPVEDNKYTTYVLGKGAIDYENMGVKVPFEMERNASKNGGETTLYSRQRKLFAPYGITFTKASMATLSPSVAELALAANWTLVTSTNGNKIDHKAIPIVRIISTVGEATPESI